MKHFNNKCFLKYSKHILLNAVLPIIKLVSNDEIEEFKKKLNSLTF